MDELLEKSSRHCIFTSCHYALLAERLVIYRLSLCTCFLQSIKQPYKLLRHNYEYTEDHNIHRGGYQGKHNNYIAKPELGVPGWLASLKSSCASKPLTSSTITYSSTESLLRVAAISRSVSWMLPMRRRSLRLSFIRSKLWRRLAIHVASSMITEVVLLQDSTLARALATSVLCTSPERISWTGLWPQLDDMR